MKLIETIVSKEQSDDWRQELRIRGVRISDEQYLEREVKDFLPSKVFVEYDVKEEEYDGRTLYKPMMGERFTFLYSNNAPYERDKDNNCKWYHYAPGARIKVRHAFHIVPDKIVTCDGVRGYILSLVEDSLFNGFVEMKNNLQKILFWDSLVAADEIAPFMKRFMWLITELYDNQKDFEETKRKYTEAGLLPLGCGINTVSKMADELATGRLRKRMQAEQEKMLAQEMTRTKRAQEIEELRIRMSDRQAMLEAEARKKAELMAESMHADQRMAALQKEQAELQMKLELMMAEDNGKK